MKEESLHLNQRLDVRALTGMRTVQGLSLLVFIIYAAYQLIFLFRNGTLDLRIVYLGPIAIIVLAGPLARLLYNKGCIEFLAKYAQICMHVLMIMLAFWLDCFTEPSLCVVYTPLFIAIGPVMLLRSMKTALIINTAALFGYCAAGLAGITPIAADHAIVTGLVAYLLSIASIIIIASMRYTISVTAHDLEYKNARVKAEQEQHRTLQEALNAAQQSSVAKTTFLNSVSHDIRTPMNAIIGYSAHAANNIDNPTVVKESLDHINNASTQLLKYLSSILEMTKAKSSRIGFTTSQFSLASIVEELRESASAAAAKKNIHLDFPAPQVEEDLVSADKERLLQVLSVAVDNAVTYTPEGGHVSFNITQGQRVSARLIRYTFTVVDDGIGMSKEFLGQVFDPFSRAHDTTHSGIAGAGLGLSLAKSMIESSGGVIHITSELGKGTQVEIVLPLGVDEHDNYDESEDPDHHDAIAKAWTSLYAVSDATHPSSTENLENTKKKKGISVAAAKAETSAKSSSSAAVSASGSSSASGSAASNTAAAIKPKPSLLSARILVVDDNMINREVAGDLLAEKGFTVDTAESGKDAVEMFKNAEPNYYSAILMDIMMPEMDGLETTSFIRELPRDDAKTVLIIALSANVHSNDSEKAIAAGMNMFLAKPFQVDSFVRILNEML